MPPDTTIPPGSLRRALAPSGMTALAALRVDRSLEQPLPEQVVDRVAALVRAGALGPGIRLPSVRDLARRLGISVHVAVEAYDRLGALGLIVTRPGAGTFVAAGLPAAEQGHHDPDYGDAAVALPGSHLPARWKPGNGYLPEAWLAEAWPAAVLHRIQRRMGAILVGDGSARGDPALREQIALRLAGQAMPVSPDNILTTLGATHAIDLILRTTLQPGDAVLAEDPGYFKLHTMLERMGVRLIPVPWTPDGPCIDTAEAACRAHRPKLFMVQTVLHNPTGGTASPATLHRLLLLAERHNLLLLEDDTYADMHPGHPVRLLQLAGGRRLIYFSSFTKMLGPATRIGYIVAERDRIEALLQAKLVSSPTVPPLAEAMVHELLAAGQYRKWIERLRPKLAAARAGAAARLRSLGFGLATEGEPGLFLWAEAPAGIDADGLRQAALGAGVLLAGGTMFRPNRQPSRHFRFNVARSGDPLMFEALAAAIEAASTQDS